MVFYDNNGVIKIIEDVDDNPSSDSKIKEKSESVSSLQTPQSRSAVHYLSISPPRIRVTDESNQIKHRRFGSPKYESTSSSKASSSVTSVSRKKVTSNPELNLPEKAATAKCYSKSPNTSSVSSRTSSPMSSSISDKNQRDVRRRSSFCLAVPTQYSNCSSKRRLSLPTTSYKMYYSGPTLQPPPISYNKLQSSSSSSGNISSNRILRYNREEINGSEKSKRNFSPQVQNPGTSSPSSSDTQKAVPVVPHTTSFIKRQSSGSIASFSSQTESYVPSSGSSSNPSAITSTSSSSNEVPEHRSSCASIHSYSTHASSRCYSISDSRRSSAATDTWNKSFCSGMTSTRSR